MRILQLLALGLVVGTSLCVPTVKLLRSTEIKLLQLMVDTRYEQRNNPEQSLACFDYYLKVFDELNEEYREGHAACLALASNKRDQFDESTQPQRDAIEELALSTCTPLKECARFVDSVIYFDCFSINGKQGTANMYRISANASETLAEVSESYRLIENEEHRCTNATGRAYVEKSYQASEDLQCCLRGESTVPTTTSSPPTTDDSSSTVPSSDMKSGNIYGDKFVPEYDLFNMRRNSKPNRT